VGNQQAAAKIPGLVSEIAIKKLCQSFKL
jgi:hypothetical protein